MSKIPNVLKAFVRNITTKGTDLKAIVASKIASESEKVQKFRKDHGNKKIGDVTINMIYGGMRGVTGLVCETSLLDPEEGIRFRGFSIPQIQEKLPKASGGEQPLPEGLFWLMLTGDIPSAAQVTWLSEQFARRSKIPAHVMVLLNNLPPTLHPMAQLSCAISALHLDSKFSKAYHSNVSKKNYWEFVYEDSMDLVAKMPVMAGIIYHNTYKGRTPIPKVDHDKDWGYNFTRMLGFDTNEMTELIRLYLTLHADHEGGNVSAHTTHLVGSALSDSYLSFAAGVNGLAGPLHGLANQQSLTWLHKVKAELGDNIPDEKLTNYIRAGLAAGVNVPGYGHAILRKTDPRYTCFREFALKHLPNDPVFKLCSQLYKLVPLVLKETQKVKNPWPNVDAHSGVCLQYYGLKEMEFYTVMFAVSRALGVLASLVWSRALGLPIERPKSMTTVALMKTMGVQ